VRVKPVRDNQRQLILGATCETDNPIRVGNVASHVRRGDAWQIPKVGLMKLKLMASGEYRYAVAVRDEDANLWLTLWVSRSQKGEFFIFIPRGDRDWDPHTSYHIDELGPHLADGVLELQTEVPSVVPYADGRSNRFGPDLWVDRYARCDGSEYKARAKARWPVRRRREPRN
jgi:hypothetical protein